MATSEEAKRRQAEPHALQGWEYVSQLVSDEHTELQTVTVSEKGQLAIPVDVRRRLNIKKGDKLLIFVHGNKVIIEKSDAISKRVKEDFGHLLKLSEKAAKKLWDNDKDAIWGDILLPLKG